MTQAASTPPMHPVTTATTESLPLRDIHLPDPISWWPIAPGWWMLLGCFVIIVSIYFIIKKIRYSRRLKRASLHEFEMIKEQYLNNKNAMQLVKELSTLLRRACISFYPRHNTAGITGKNWLDYLDSTLPDAIKKSSNSVGFNSEIGRYLLTAPYLPENSLTSDIDTEALLDLCERWLNAQPVKSDSIKLQQPVAANKELPQARLVNPEDT